MVTSPLLLIGTVSQIKNKQKYGNTKGFESPYYSTIAPFYHIWSRERAKYDAVLHCRTEEYKRKAQNRKMIGENENN